MPAHRDNAQLCPHCDGEVTARQMNITEGVALCPHCDTLSRLHELNYSGKTSTEVLGSAPKGITITPGYQRMEVKVSLFSPTAFIGSLAVTLFWNGIVSVFLSLAAAAVYYQLFGPIPEWFPCPGLEDGRPIMNDQVMGPGMTIFFCLFLTPFLIIGSGMIINTLLRLAGTTRVVIDPYQCKVSTGISLLRLSRRFDPYKVGSIDLADSKFNNENTSQQVIVIEADRSVKFGRLFNATQQDWMHTLLKKVFFHKHSPELSHVIPEMPWLAHRK